MEVFVQYLWTLLQNILGYVLPILATQVAILLGAWIVKVFGDLKAKLSADQLVMLQTAVKIAVQAAEQLKLKDAAIDKKNEALKIAQNYLDAHKVKIDLATLDAAIEAAVFENFNAVK